MSDNLYGFCKQGSAAGWLRFGSPGLPHGVLAGERARLLQVGAQGGGVRIELFRADVLPGDDLLFQQAGRRQQKAW
jgi:hypothetical protein